MSWESFLLQLPVVAAFVWYSLELQKRYQASMDKRDEAYLSALNRITACIDAHDDKVDERVAAIRQGAAAARPEPGRVKRGGHE